MRGNVQLSGGCCRSVHQVMDSLVISLSKFTSVLNPSSPKPAMAFGENDKMRMATETVFALASRWASLSSPSVPGSTIQPNLLLRRKYKDYVIFFHGIVLSFFWFIL